MPTIPANVLNNLQTVLTRMKQLEKLEGEAKAKGIVSNKKLRGSDGGRKTESTTTSVDLDLTVNAFTTNVSMTTLTDKSLNRTSLQD